MTMRGGGGYLMWCQRVLPASEPEVTNNIEVRQEEEGESSNDITKKQKLTV